MIDQQVLDAAVEFIIDGYPPSLCRAYISEYGVEADELRSLMQKAQHQFEQWNLEVGKELRF
jgi:hypothetical protein